MGCSEIDRGETKPGHETAPQTLERTGETSIPAQGNGGTKPIAGRWAMLDMGEASREAGFLMNGCR